MKLSLDGSIYCGTLLQAGEWSYGVAQADARPYVLLNGRRYESANRLYTSDNWAVNSTGTTGDNWPTQLGELNLTLSYDGAILTVYRNGVIDQKLDAPRLNVKNLKVDGYAGTLGNVTVYNRCLTQDEVKHTFR